VTRTKPIGEEEEDKIMIKRALRKKFSVSNKI